MDTILAEQGKQRCYCRHKYPDFNPIEKTWSLKAWTEGSLTGKVNMIGAEEWKRTWEHAIECENEYCRHEHALDVHTDRLVINTVDSDVDGVCLDSTGNEIKGTLFCKFLYYKVSSGWVYDRILNEFKLI